MKYIGILAVMALIIGGGIYFTKRNPVITACTMDAKTCPDGSSVGRVGPNCEFAACPGETETDKNANGDDIKMVSYTRDGFNPKVLTIPVGTTVSFVNENISGPESEDQGTGIQMWVGSDDHPTHTKYAGTALREHCPDTSGTAFDQCKIGEQFIFTFTKPGTWNYHNHRNAAHTGTIVVQ